MTNEPGDLRNVAGRSVARPRAWWELPIELAVLYWVGSEFGVVVAKLLAGTPPGVLYPWSDFGLVVDNRIDLAWLPETIALSLAVRALIGVRPILCIAVIVPLAVGAAIVVPELRYLSATGLTPEVKHQLIREMATTWTCRAVTGGLLAGGLAAYRRKRLPEHRGEAMGSRPTSG